MNGFKNLKISSKLFIMVSLFILVMVVVTSITYYDLNKLGRMQDEGHKRTLDAIKVKSGESSADRLYAIIADAEINRDLANSEKIWAVAKVDELKLIKDINAFLVTPDQIRLGSQSEKALNEFINLYDTKMLPLLKSTNEMTLSIREIDSKLDQQMILVEEPMNLLSELIVKEADQGDLDFDSTRQNTMLKILFISIFSAVILIILSIMLIKLIKTPLLKAVEMISELSQGHLSMRLGLTTNDEIGIMAKSMDKFADDLQNVVIGTMQKISLGDVSTIIEPKDNRDEISPALKRTILAIRSLVDDSNMLSKAAIEGKLSTRVDVSKHSGDFAKIIDGVNKTLDAVIEPVKEASDVLQEMAKGNFKVSVLGNYKGDHAEIKDSLNFTISTVASYIDEISTVLNEMAAGNLVVGITNEYLGDFIEIKNSLNYIINSLNEVLGDINVASEQVASGSRQVSDSSQSLSQGSTEQSSSIEELTASITQIASQTKQNAINANQANNLALSAKENAVQGNSRMQEMLKAMGEINDSSGNISKIIKVIDEIAFQTNILALNAAVEAARAGQHGKGFAVVAEEVRNLAARSANAAKETTSLIEGSIKKVEFGTIIAKDTAEALVKIVEGVSKSATLVGEIAVASNEQATGISQINQGVSQISMVVQNNSATAEQSAAASEELSSQADLLKSMVGKFKLKKTQGFEGQNGVRQQQYIEQKRRSSFIKNDGLVSKPKITLTGKEFGKY